LRSSEEQLRETQKLEAVGRLAGGVAHDMNNALNAIIAFADLALQGAGDNEGLRDDIGEIRQAADRAAGITRRLLAFSRRQVLQPQVLEVNAIVTSVEDMLRRLIGEHIGLSLRWRPTPAGSSPIPRKSNRSSSIWRSTLAMPCPRVAI
jgi:two-component system cell cycle sensor histidine kinase/response regulator CckA